MGWYFPLAMLHYSGYYVSVMNGKLTSHRRRIVHVVQLLFFVALFTQRLDILNLRRTSVPDCDDMVARQFNIRFASAAAGTCIIIHPFHEFESLTTVRADLDTAMAFLFFVAIAIPGFRMPHLITITLPSGSFILVSRQRQTLIRHLSSAV